MRTTGKSLLEIGKLLDVSSACIKEYCDDNGIKKFKIGGGAYYHYPSGRWHCLLRQNGVDISLGYYKIRGEAIAVFNRNARERSGSDVFCIK